MARRKWRKRGTEGASLPELAPINRTRQPREKGRFAAPPQEDARRTALTARCQQLGIEPTREARRLSAAPHLGSDMGRVMDRLAPDDVTRLWSVWQTWCSVERTYAIRFLGRTGDAQNAALPILPEAMQTDALSGHSTDLRSTEEKDRDAVNAWMRWRGHHFRLLDGNEGALLIAAKDGTGPPLWHADRHAPTGVGADTLRALVHLADIAARG